MRNKGFSLSAGPVAAPAHCVLGSNFVQPAGQWAPRLCATRRLLLAFIFLVNVSPVFAEQTPEEIDHSSIQQAYKDKFYSVVRSKSLLYL